MRPAYDELAAAIDATTFSEPFCPIYQNVTASATSDPALLKENLKKHILSPVKWVDTINNMVDDGATEFQEVGPGKILQGLVKKIQPDIEVSSISSVPAPKEEEH